MPKRIVICADGTWNTADQPHPTNVVKMARAVRPTAPDGVTQVVFYDPGVGTQRGLDRLTGGAFGQGLDENILDAYHFLINNYDEGDTLFLFGFSRGAYTVRSLVGLIRNSGLLRKPYADLYPKALNLYRRRDPGSHPDSEEAVAFKRDYSREIEVWFIGVWDTVGALGIPLQGLRALTRRKHQFHDVELSKIVRNAYHAVAIDERRGPFEPSLWDYKSKTGQTVEQVWFAGVHSDVGGGFAEPGLSDLAFTWMMRKAEACGMALDHNYLQRVLKTDGAGPLHDSLTWAYRLLGPIRRPIGTRANEAVHPEALARHTRTDLGYGPANLVGYLDGPDHVIAKVE